MSFLHQWRLDFELEAPREEAAPLAEATLFVASGLHQGARIELTAREYLIGSDEDCDIVLHDAQVAPRHCRLIREWSGFSLQDIRAEPAQKILPRTVSYHPSGIRLVFDVAGVSLVLRPQRAGAAGRGQPYPAWVLYGALLAGTLALALVLAGGARVSASSTRTAVAPPTARDHRRGALSDIVEQVRHALAGQDLQIGLQDGRLKIAGTTRELEVKNRIRSLGEDLRGIIAIDDRVAYVDTRERSTIQTPLPVTVRGVMVGNPSYFLTDRGDRFYVGGLLPDGAEVISIEASRILFRRGGRTMVYNLE